MSKRREDTVSAVDPEQAKERKTQAEIDDLQEKEDLRWLLSEEHGIRWFKRFLARNHVFTTTFNKHSALMSFLEGERNVALRVLASIEEVNPDAVSRIMLNNINGGNEE